MAASGGDKSIVNSSFIGGTIWSTFFWLFIQIFMIMILIPSSWLGEVVDQEDAWLYEALGNGSAMYVEEQGYAWYRAIFIDTGINDYVASIFFMTEQQRTAAVGLQNFGQELYFPWLEGRAEALVFLLVQMFERLAQVYLWIPYAFIIIIPAIWDGYMVWKIRQYTFEYSSPFMHRVSINTTRLIFMVITLGLFIPLPIHPYIIPTLLIFVLPVMMIALVSNLPKSI